METILREERYIARLGAQDQIFRVQELVSGAERWPESFRIQVPASLTRGARTIYGASARDAVAKAMAYLASGNPLPRSSQRIDAGESADSASV
jgi:phenylacetate-coenzyme A ligase PaaK-like adenylate-forming protein